LKREYEIAIRWRAFPLHPDTPEDGLLIEKLFADYPVDVKKIMRKLRKKAEDLELPFGTKNYYKNKMEHNGFFTAAAFNDQC
jgi:hypothetical protein